MEQLCYISKYAHIIEFTRNNPTIYFIVLNFFISLIIFSLALFILTTIKINDKNQKVSPCTIIILKSIIPFISSFFFGQIFFTLLTPFYCDENNTHSFFSESYNCLGGLWFDVESILCIISIVFLFFISYITNLIFYNPMCLRAKNKKIHSLTDVIFLFTKIIMNLLFLFFRSTNDNYPLLLLCILFTGINLYCLYSYQGYSNKILYFINNAFATILLWGFICLFIGKILNLIGFNGTSYLFLIGIIFIIIYIYYKIEQMNLFFMIDKSKISSSIEYYKYILHLQTLIEDKNKSRENKLIFKSFLKKMEENNVQNDYFLKKYLICLEKGIDCDILLYYYMQKLFEEGLNKFNNDLTLTISYIYFLVKRLSKKKKALLLYKSIDKDIYSIDKLFNIYRCQKILDTLWTGFDGKDKENIESVDVIKIFDYKNNVNQFVDLLNKISLLYYDFWLALFSNNCEGKDEFKTLNEIGSKINELLNPIEQTFNLIYHIKNDDIEVLKLYLGYIKNILNNNEKFEQYQHILTNISKDFIFETKQIDYSSFDINSLHDEKKEVEYFIVGASEVDSNERKIINMSIGLSTIIGYQKSEIIGKDINVLIPKIFHSAHNKMIKEYTKNLKVNLYQNLSNEIKYTPDVLFKTVYCKTKSNFLKQLEIKVYLVQTEDGEHIYILEVIRSSSFPTSWNEKGEDPSFCILTDKNFIIQTFTTDCCKALGLNSNAINSTFEITSCIVQFNEDINNNYREYLFNKGGNSSFNFDNSDFISTTNIMSVGNKKIHRSSTKNILSLSTNVFTRNNSSNKINNIFAQNQTNKVDSSIDIKNRIKRKLVKNKYIYPQVIIWRMNENYLNALKDEERKNSIFFNNTLLPNKIIENSSNKFELTVKECRISKALIGYYFIFKKIKLIRFKNIEFNEEVNCFKRYISNTAEDEQSDYKNKNNFKESSNYSFGANNMNKSNTEITNKNKSNFYISHKTMNIDDKENKANKDNRSLTEINAKKSNISEEEKQNLSIYLISDLKDDNLGENKIQKEFSLNGLEFEKGNDSGVKNETEQIIFNTIDRYFLPNITQSFDFDLESMSYIPSKNEGNQNKISNLLTFYRKKIESLHINELYSEESSSSNKIEEESSNENGSSATSFLSINSLEEKEEKEDKEREENKVDKEKEEDKENGKENENKEKGDEEKEIKFSENENPSPNSKKNSIKKHTIREDRESFINELLSPLNNGKVKSHFKTSSSKINKYSSIIHQSDYYKIKFDNMRSFYYDFIKDMVVEDYDYEKKSQIEILLEKYKNKEYSPEMPLFSMWKNNNNNFSNFLPPNSELLKEGKHRRHHSRKKFTKITLDQKHENNNNNDENKKINNIIENGEDLQNKIKESLSQEDKQKPILIFSIISFINDSFLVAVGILVNYFIIYRIKNDINNIHLICYSAELRTFYNVAVYYLRELTLVNFKLPNNTLNEEYTQYPDFLGNRTGYIQSLINKINNIYVETHILTESLTSVDIPLSEKAKQVLQENNLTLYVLTNNLRIYPISTTFSISLIQLNSALNNLVSSDSPIQQNVTDIYIFIHNYLNEIGKGVEGQIEIYIKELELRKKRNEITIIIGLIAIYIFIIILFIFIYLSYKSIIKKKASYIEGFYGIKLQFIQQSIKNCEFYIYYLKKHKKEEESGLKHEKTSQISENDDENSKDFEEEMKFFDSFSGNNKNNDDFYNSIFNKRNATNQINVNKDAYLIFFGTSVFLYMNMIVLFFVIVCLVYVKFMNDITRYSKFIFHLQRSHNNIIELFNGYREYLFDEKTIIDHYESEEFLKIKLEEIFNTIGNDNYIINSTYSGIKNYKDIYIKFNRDSLCTRMGENYFESVLDCENFLEGQIKYGYQITSFTLVDLIRMGSNFIKYYLEKEISIVGNLTEYGINEYKNISDNQKFRLYLFNNKITHDNINVIFYHLLLPYYFDIINETSSYVINSTNNAQSLYVIIMICYVSITIVSALALWVPFVVEMNSLLNNSKKILRIIPIHILSTLTNIKKILNLEKTKSG